MSVAGYLGNLHRSGRKVSMLDRYHAYRAGHTPPHVTFTNQPEPRSIGSYARGKQLVAGNLQFGGFLLQAKKMSIWDITPPDDGFCQELHGFLWLDDLAAVGDLEARSLAQNWVAEWTARYGAGRGPGWVPDLTGRRVIRWINHAVFLLNGQASEASRRYFDALARQINYLSRRWSATSHGLPRFEALTGLIYAGISLEGMGHVLEPASVALARECVTALDAGGGIESRNPEELVEIFSLLVWACDGLTEADHMPTPEHMYAIERIAPVLRALRHSDGALARFHGGDRGVDGRVDQALAASGIRPVRPDGMAMGYSRMHAARTTLIADVAQPPQGPASIDAHASTLAFEMTSARRPIIVSCGSGTPFGTDWQRAGRGTPSHSTLAIKGASSSTFDTRDGREMLTRVPRNVRATLTLDVDGHSLIASHDGYVPKFGLTHRRSLKLSEDGRMLSGDDTLAALSEPDRITFERYMDQTSLQGVAFTVRFHLHPEVDAELDMGGHAVSLSLKSGEIWIFRASSGVEMSLDPSVFLEKGRLKPRATKQVVLSGRVMEYAAHVNWSLSKAQVTPTYLRDVKDDLELALT